MAALAEAPMGEYNTCLLVRPSPSTSLHFSSVSDYLHHLITHGECYAGVNIEPCGPPAGHLEVSKAPPPLEPLLNGSKSSSVKTVLKDSSLSELSCPDEQGFTPLLYAALTGSHDIVTALLKAGVPPDTCHSATGASPLSVACIHNNPDTVKVLLKHRASTIADQESHGCSPLHCAAWAGSIKSVKLLLSHSPTLISVRDLAGRTALHYASAKCDVTMCQLLLKKGAKLSETDNAGRTCLHWAILSLQQHCVECLLAASSNTAATLCNQSDSHGATPVHYAAMTGKCDLVTALANKGGNMTVHDSSGYCPLVWACACGCVDTARQLLQLTCRGTPSSDDPDNCDGFTDGGLCLRLACGVGSLDVCQLLIGASSSVAKVGDEEGRTALHTASLHGHTECLDEVLEAGAPPNTATHTEHKTSLHISSEMGHCEAVLSLLAAGASYDLPTHPAGERPIHLAARSGRVNILRELIIHGCAPDIRRANDGETALHLAAEAGHTECCRTLLERGADPRITETSIQSRTALDLALAGGHREVADYLISQGAPSGGGIFHRAALTIQAVWRLHRHRRRCRSRQQWSAVMIQRAVRRWRRRGMARRVRAVREKTRHTAVATIQKNWRQYMEGRRRYEATYARLRARLHQEHLAASLLLEELQSQAHSIQLPPPSTSSCVPLLTAPCSSTLPHTQRAPPAPGYLLQASAPLPRPLITSASLLSPARQHRPRKTVTSRPPPQPQQHRQRQRRGEVAIDATLPPIPAAQSSQAQLSSKMNRGSPPSYSHKIAISKKPTKSSGEAIERIPEISSSSPGVVGVVSSRASEVPSESELNKEVADKLYPLPQLRSTPSQSSPPLQTSLSPLTSPPSQTLLPPLTSPPSQTSPHPMSPPSQISPPPQAPSPSSPPPNVKVTDDKAAIDKNKQSNSGQETAKSDRDDAGNSEQDSETEVSTSNSQHPYMKKTVFRAALLGKKMQDRGAEEQRGLEEEVDSRLLGPIQRYDRLNRVLSLLQQVQESESGGGEGEEVKLSSLREHIQTALDEAVRLRADTDSLHTTLTRKSTNSVRTT